MKIRIDKLLSNMGFGSRSDVKKMIKYGQILMDGKVINNAAEQIEEGKALFVKGKKIVYRQYIYLMLNKPSGVVSATEDRTEKTVLDLLSNEYKARELFPIGRLDKDTEGLLILTNDGGMAHDLLSPKKHVPKTYYAKIKGKVGSDDIESFEQGVVLDDEYKTLPAKLEIIKSGENSEIELTITEGKFHQVKRMFEAVGKKVTYLKRISMGNLILDYKLELGEYRELSQDELELLQAK